MLKISLAHDPVVWAEREEAIDEFEEAYEELKKKGLEV